MTTDPTLPSRIRSDSNRASRVRQYDTNRRYYEGRHDILNRRRRPRARPRNLIGLFVDTVVAHMGEPSIAWAPPGNDPGELARFDDYVARALARNGGAQLLYDTELACSIDGDAAAKVTWDDTEGRVRITHVDCATLWTEGRPDDPRATELVAQQYEMAPRDAPVMFPARVVTLARKVLVTEEWSAARWRVWLDEDLMADEPNPYGHIPYVVFPNVRTPGAIWGRGDPEGLQALQDGLNDAAHEKDQLMTVAGNIVVISGADTAGDDGALAIAPGTVWELPEGARAHVLDVLASGSLQAHHEHMAELRAALHILARVPEAALGGDAAGSAPISGAALAIKLQPLVRLVARKRLSRTAALQNLARQIVALGHQFDGLPPPPADAPAVIWTDAIPADRADDLSAAEAEIRIGRSRAAVLTGLGYDAEAELTARARENRTLGETDDRPAPAPAPAAAE